MKIYKFSEMNQSDVNRIFSRGSREFGEIEKIVRDIINDVKVNGDDALIRLEKKLDNCDLTKSGFYVEEKDINESETLVNVNLKESIDLAIANIKDFHSVQSPQKMWIQPFGRGILAGEIYNPIDSVGLYVPHGKGSFPSVAIMLGVPATIAGVKNIVVITPPDKECNVDPNVLYVCKVLGISKVLKLGGAQAIAAVALGTKSVEKVSKILGPGSLYVNIAKQLLAGRIDIGLLAGPSESIVIADHTQNPLNVALDLINEAEHGPDSTSLLLTDSSDLVNSVNSLVDKLIERIDENRRKYVEKVLEENGGAIIFNKIDDAISFTNNFAPEHLVLDLSNPLDVLGKIKNAGEILIGPNTPISAGNYLAGPNAVLPTNGFAKSMSVLSVRDFLKVTSVLKFSPEALTFYKDHIRTLALAEGFPAHAMSASERIVVQSDITKEDDGITIYNMTENSINITRETRESSISVSLYFGQRDIEGKRKINTPLNFLNHMLETISWRSGINISVKVSLEGAYKLMHVVAEDVGISIGTAVSKLINQQIAKGIEGSGSAFGIIDEAESMVALSFEGRSSFQIKYLIPKNFEFVEDMKSADLENFLSGFAQGARCTIHATILSGTDPHHIWESLFRAFGESLRRCFDENKFRKGTTPGVKGI